MKATIYQGTPYEISWSLEDPLTPELVDQIEEAGIELDIDWEKNQFFPIVKFLLEHYSSSSIIDRLYDEDPDLIELISLKIQHPLDAPNENFEVFIRLYIPVIIIILQNIPS